MLNGDDSDICRHLRALAFELAEASDAGCAGWGRLDDELLREDDPRGPRAGVPQPERRRIVVHEGDFDEVIVSTLPKQRSKWLRRDLIRRIEGLGLPVTPVIPKVKSVRATIDDSDDLTRGLIGGGGG